MRVDSASNAWIGMSNDEANEIWDSFDGKFSFRPSVSAADFPSIIEPVPSITHQISQKYDDADIADLETKVLAALKRLVGNNEKICVLDWQHNCYWFYPHQTFENWMTPVLPNGDYYIFLAPNLEFGIFGHPWEWTSCVWGKRLLEILEDSKPKIWVKIKRHK